jgi:predicted PurR-regulated permease PerM
VTKFTYKSREKSVYRLGDGKMDQTKWQRWRDILICTICAGIIIWALWNFLNQFIDAILLFLLSMAIAFLISPAVNSLAKYKIPRLLATLIVYVVVLALLVAVGYALIFSLIDQVQQFSNTVATFVQNFPDHIKNIYDFLIQHGIPEANIQTAINQIQNQAYNFTQQATTSVIGVLFFLSNAFIDIVLVIVISFYLTLDGRRIRNNIIAIVPRRSRPHVLLFEDALNRVVGNYIRGQLLLAIIIGILVSLVCALTGLGQFALIFGALGFLFETIPMVGPFLASVSPILASLLLPDPFPRTLWVILCFVIIQALESNVLGPRIVGHAVGLHPVASIMALLIFARLFSNAFGAFGGAMGALIATPVVAAIWVVIASMYRSAHGETSDQMLARRRAPWRPPALPRAFRLKPSSAGEDTRSSPVAAEKVGQPQATGDLEPESPDAGTDRERASVITDGEES